MIYNENGIRCKMINKELFLEGLRDDSYKKVKMIENLTMEIVNNTEEIKKVRSFDTKALNKLKRTTRLIGFLEQIFLTLLMGSGAFGGLISIIEFFHKKIMPAVISVATLVVGAVGTGYTDTAHTKLAAQLSQEIAKLMELLENDKMNSYDLSPEVINQINELKRLKSELDSIKDKQSQNDTKINKEVDKYVKQYKLDKKLADYLKADDWYEWAEPVTTQDYLNANNENSDGGVFIGVILSAKQINNIVETECIIYGKDDSFYVGEGYLQYGDFTTSFGQKFNIKLDGKAVYDYREEDYIDDNDSGVNGSGKYKIVFDLPDNKIKLTRGTIFFYTIGF